MGKDNWLRVSILAGKMFVVVEIYSEEQFNGFILVSNSFKILLYSSSF
jgi:hypothetical protein